MIIDCHGHIFPFLGGPNGFASAQERMRIMQLTMKNAQPRRKSDRAIVVEPTLWDGKTEGFEGLLDVNFRAGRFGRYEWDKDGQTYYFENFPPSLQDMACTAEYMVAQMDFVGVDMVVLQNEFLYGYLNDYFGEALRAYPDRFIATAKLREPEAHTDAQLGELRRCVKQLGFRGLYFQRYGLQLAGRDTRLDAPLLRPLWDEVRELGVMVYLHGYFEQWREVAAFAERYPEVPLVHWIPTWNFPREGIGRMPREGKVHLRQDIRELLSLPNMHFELCPIAYGAAFEYPYTELIPTFRPYYEEFGGTKFIWGADMPNLERWCTYQQGLDYLRYHWDFISREDLKLLTGGNAARIFKIAAP